MLVGSARFATRRRWRHLPTVLGLEFTKQFFFVALIFVQHSRYRIHLVWIVFHVIGAQSLFIAFAFVVLVVIARFATLRRRRHLPTVLGLESTKQFFFVALVFVQHSRYRIHLVWIVFHVIRAQSLFVAFAFVVLVAFARFATRRRRRHLPTVLGLESTKQFFFVALVFVQHSRYRIHLVW